MEKRISGKDIRHAYRFFLKTQSIVAEIKTYKSTGHFLDIGYGFGVLLKVAKDQGFRVLGVEKEKNVVEIAKKMDNFYHSRRISQGSTSARKF